MSPPPNPIGFRRILNSVSDSSPDPHRDPASTAEEALILDDVRLRGSIDLMERHATRKALTASPTTRPAKRRKTVRSTWAAARCSSLCSMRWRPKHYWANPWSRAGSFTAPSAATSRPSTFRSTTKARGRLGRILETIDRSIAEGFLPAAPQTGACSMCDYTAVCGPYEETRVKRKQSDRLDPLIEIRHSP